MNSDRKIFETTKTELYTYKTNHHGADYFITTCARGPGNADKRLPHICNYLKRPRTIVNWMLDDVKTVIKCHIRYKHKNNTTDLAEFNEIRTPRNNILEKFHILKELEHIPLQSFDMVRASDDLPDSVNEVTLTYFKIIGNDTSQMVLKCALSSDFIDAGLNKSELSEDIQQWIYTIIRSSDLDDIYDAANKLASLVMGHIKLENMISDYIRECENSASKTLGGILLQKKMIAPPILPTASQATSSNSSTSNDVPQDQVVLNTSDNTLLILPAKSSGQAMKVTLPCIDKFIAAAGNDEALSKLFHEIADNLSEPKLKSSQATLRS